MLVCREHSLPENGSWPTWLWGNICIQADQLAQVSQTLGGGSILFGGSGGMEFPRVWDLGYVGWAKATDHTENCEFFSMSRGMNISLLFGTHPCVEWFLIGTQRVG